MAVAMERLRRGTLSEMNVVPLIDILLVLLIIFMMLAPMKLKGLEAQVPQSSRDGPLQPEVVVLEVLDGGALRINQQPVTWIDLEPRLSGLFKERSEKVAYVRGEPGVDFSQVAHAIDCMRGAGIDAVGLLTPELEKRR